MANYLTRKTSEAMKKIYLFSSIGKVFTLVVLMLSLGFIVQAQTTYTWTGATGTSWEVAANWNPSTGVPGSGVGDIVIIPGTTNKPILSVAPGFTITSLTFSSSDPNPATLTINTGVTLNVTGAVTLISAYNSNTACTLAGEGTLNCASVVVGTNYTGNNSQTRSAIMTSNISNLIISEDLNLLSNWETAPERIINATFTVPTGTVTINGSVITTNENTANTSTFSLGGTNPTLNLGGTTLFILSGTGNNTITLNGAGATVNYNRNGAQPVWNAPYTNLILSGSGVKTLSGNCTTSGTLTIEDGTTLDNSGYTVIPAGNLNLSCGGGGAGASITGNGILTLGGNVIVTDAGNGTAGATILCPVSLGDTDKTFDIADDETSAVDLTISGIISNPTTASGLIKTGVGTMVFSGNNTFSGGLTITSGTVQIGASDVLADDLPVTLNGGTLSTGSETGFGETAGTLNLAVNSTINLATGSHSLKFSNSSAESWAGSTLTITGWTGIAGLPGTAGKIFIGTDATGLTSNQLGKITFQGFSAGAQILSTGEVVPLLSPTTGDYQSVAIGSWTALSTWQRYNGTTWVTPSASEGTPTNSSGIITIRNTHIVIISTSVSVDQVRVEAGGSVRLSSSAILTITEGEPGDDFIVYGSIERRTGTNTIEGTGTLFFASGSEYRHQQDGGDIPFATWDINSNCNITGVMETMPGNLDQLPGFGNLTWNCSNMYDPLSLLTGIKVNGNFTILNTGDYSLSMSNNTQSNTITVDGDLNVANSAVFKMNEGSGSCTLNIGRDLNITSSFYLNSYNGSASAIVNVSGNVNVSSGRLNFSDEGNSLAIATLNLKGDFNHTGGLVQNTLAGGTYSGTINFTGTEKQTFKSTVSGITAGHVININVATGSYLQMAEPGTIVSGAGSFILSAGATLGVTSPDGISGTGGLTGNILVTGTRSYNREANYIYNGTSPQSTGAGLPSEIRNLTFDNIFGSVSFPGNRNISNNFSITTGSKANLGNGRLHFTGTLTLGGIDQIDGTYGHSSSPALYKDDIYFDASTGVVNNSVNTWTGMTTDWNFSDNWSGGTPSAGSKVLITSAATNQPIISNSPDAECTNITINPGASLTISPAGRAKFTSLKNNGTLNLESDENGIASLIIDSYTDNGTENIQLYLTGSDIPTNNFWHYISSPIAELPVGALTGTTWDIAHFVESLPSSGSAPFTWQRGWVAYDGWSYETEDYSAGYSGFTNMESGKGYNYWHSTTHLFEFSGTINTSDPAPSISFSGDPAWSGYNLLGNPYTSGIDIQKMFDDPGWTSALKSVWFTKDGISYIYQDGEISVPSGTNSTIPPMQGFFVQATESGTINFPLGARAHSSTPRYKGDKSPIPLVRLSISANGKSEETVVRFDEKATDGIDISFDAPRFISSAGTPSIYTALSGREFTINGIPFPDPSVEIPVIVKLLADGNHTITAMEIIELGDYNVTLTDKVTKTVTDLNAVKEYNFAASAGLIKDRFILSISNRSTDIDNPVDTENLFNIYHGFGQINIQPLSDEWDGKSGSVKIMDLSGKAVRLQQNNEFRKNTLIQLPSPETQGIYFIEIRSGLMRHVGKIVIK